MTKTFIKFYLLPNPSFLFAGKKVLESVIQTTHGTYYINKDVHFTGDLVVNNLTAFKFLNSVPVTRDGRLDILLNDVPEQQSITGTKHFENLELYDSIKLQGHIVGKRFIICCRSKKSPS